jgi:hypothetical protein
VSVHQTTKNEREKNYRLKMSAKGALNLKVLLVDQGKTSVMRFMGFMSVAEVCKEIEVQYHLIHSALSVRLEYLLQKD